MYFNHFTYYRTFSIPIWTGVSVIDYDLNELVSQADLEELNKLGIDLKFDFVLNHSSVLSPQFQIF